MKNDIEKIEVGEFEIEFSGYGYIHVNNGQHIPQNFTNVSLESKDFSEFIRIYRESEKEDLRRLVLMCAGSSIAKLGSEIISKFTELIDSGIEIDNETSLKIKEFRTLVSTPYRLPSELKTPSY